MIHLFNGKSVTKINLEEKEAVTRFCKILFGPTPDPYLLGKVESIGAAKRKMVLELLGKLLDNALEGYRKHVEGVDLGQVPAEVRPAFVDFTRLVRSMGYSPHTNPTNTMNDLETLQGMLEDWKKISPLLPAESAQLPSIDFPGFSL
jgi:hypothetical protein